MPNQLTLLFNRRNLPAWVILIACLSLLLLAWQGARTTAEKNAQQQFELHVRDVMESIETRLRQHEQILLGGAGLFDANNAVGRGAWRAYVERLKLGDNYPGIQGLGFSKLIRPAELPAHIAAIRAAGFPDYTVRPPGARDLYTSIIYLEPFVDRNLAAFGFDMMSEPTRAKAMRRAAESGQTAISGKVKLVQEIRGQVQAGFLMYVPVYRQGQLLTSAAARWDALLGFVYSPYRVNDLMHGIMGERETLVDFSIYDGVEENADALMYDSERNDPTLSHPEHTAMLSTLRTVQAYGQQWTVRLHSHPAFEARFSSSEELPALTLGGAVSLLLFMLVSFLISRRDRAEELAQKMTADIRRNEEELRYSKQLLDSIIENIPAMVFLKRAEDLRFELFNHAGEVLLGYSRHDLLGKNDYELFPREQADFFTMKDRKVLGSGEIKDIAEEPITTASGETRYLHTLKIALRNAAGQATHLLGISIDITARKAAEQAQKESAQRTQAILDNVVDGIITIDTHGAIQSFNRAAEHIFGYSAAEVVGHNIKLLMPEPYHSQHDGYLDNFHTTNMARIIGIGREVEGRCKDGRTFPMDLAVSQSSHQGQPLFIGLVRDITERKRVDKMKNEFISTVSHELRTPLTAIRGALGLINGGAVGALPEQAKAMLAIASNNTERLLLLINDILDMQKIESGQMVFRFEALELMPFLQQVLEELAGYAQQYQVHFVITHTVADAQLFADKDRLAQVMSNLLSNAAKFSPAGATVEIAVARRHDNRLRISVTDSGPGIPEEFQPRLFERFTQHDSSDSRNKGGTGLGLTITKSMVEKHGGAIGFITRSGIGTTFYIDLPELASSSAQLSTITAPPQQQHATILIVEDDADVAVLIQRMLAEAGFDSDIAHDAAQARALLAERGAHYRLMTLDLALPGENGISLYTSLRQDEATRHLPVVILSANADESRRALSGSAIDVVDWLRKPIDQQRLIDSVRRAARPAQRLRLLHVEDDPDLRQVISALLQQQCELLQVTTVAAARTALTGQEFDLVLLDIGLPDGSGLELLETIKRCLKPARVVIFSAQEVDANYASQVSDVLVKSKTNAHELMQRLMAAIEHE